jgi:hypothetical protein
VYGSDIFAVIQVLMEATNGLGIILENRYYGGSYPFNSSTTDELAYLTTEQSKWSTIDHKFMLT